MVVLYINGYYIDWLFDSDYSTSTSCALLGWTYSEYIPLCFWGDDDLAVIKPFTLVTLAVDMYFIGFFGDNYLGDFQFYGTYLLLLLFYYLFGLYRIILWFWSKFLVWIVYLGIYLCTGEFGLCASFFFLRSGSGEFIFYFLI